MVALSAHAIVFDRTGHADHRSVDLTPPGEGDVVINVDVSGIRTGTECLLREGTMPDFPVMGDPLVPGCKSIGQEVWAGPRADREVGEHVLDPGAACFGSIRDPFGRAPSTRLIPSHQIQFNDASRVRENSSSRGIAIDRPDVDQTQTARKAVFNNSDCLKNGARLQVMALIAVWER